MVRYVPFDDADDAKTSAGQRDHDLCCNVNQADMGIRTMRTV